MTTVLLPVMAKVQNDKIARRDLYLAVLHWSALICFSTSVGVALVAQDMASVILGPQWTDVAVLMPWFALTWGMWGISGTANSALDTIGKPKISTKLQWISVAALSLSIFLVAHFHQSILSIAITRLVVTVALAPVSFFTLARALEIPLVDFVVAIWRSAISGLVMAIVVLAANSGISFSGPLRLFLDIALGTAAYASSGMLLWLYVGRPEGPEAEVCRYVRKLFQPAVTAVLHSPEDH
jgi:PST family polysaccharide transporter